MPRGKIKSIRFEDQTQNQTLRGLITPLEEHLQENDDDKQAKRTGKKVNETYTQGQQYEQDEQINNIPMSQIKQIDAEKLSVLVNQLIAKNKISAKNAFEVPLVHLSQTSDYNTMNGDNSWKKVSSALQNNNKIYGYRVDATHSFTYKMLQLVTRSERKQGTEEQQQFRSHRYDNNTLNTQFFADCVEDYYIRHLERNQKNINIMHLDTFFNVNPILQKTKRTFDQQGLRGLLLNNIEIDEELALCISLQNCKKKKKTTSKDQETEEADEFNMDQGLYSYNIFSKIYGICCINDLLDNEHTQVKRQESEFQTIWKQYEETSNPQKKQRKQCYSIQIDIQQAQPVNKEASQSDKSSSDGKDLCQKPSDEKAIEEDKGVNFQNKEVENKLNKITENQQNCNIESNALQENGQSNKGQAQPIQKEVPDQIEGNANCEGAQDEQKKHKQQVQQQQSNNLKGQIQPTVDQGVSHNTIINETPLSIPLEQIAITDVATSQTINDSTITRSTNDQLEVKEVPITSEITFNSLKKQRIPSDKVLHQMTVVEDYVHDKESAIQKWKNSEKKPKVQRKPRPPRDPMLDYINFKEPLDMRKKNNRRSSILKVDKLRKLQIKKFLKSIQKNYQEDKYVYLATSKDQIDFHLLSFLRQTIAQKTRQEPQQNNRENHQLNYPGAIDLQNLNQTSTTNMAKSASIRSVKEKLRGLMLESKIDSFAQIYSEFVDLEGYISPALCFLTVLHLCNEHGLQLVQEQSSDFKIIWQSE